MSGGSDTTKNYYNTYETGLGDEQFADLTANQADLSGALSGLADTTTQQYGSLTQQLGDAQQGTLDALAGGFTSTQDAINQANQTLNQNVADNLNQVRTDLGGQMTTGFTSLGDQLGTVGGQLNDQLSSGLTNINDTIYGGFTQTGDALTNLAGAVGGMQDNVMGRIGDAEGYINSGFNDMSGLMSQWGNLGQQERQNLYDALSQGMDTGFAANQEGINTAQANLMQAQDRLRQNMEEVGGRLDTYYGGLSQAQQQLGQQIGGVQGGLNDFTNRYDRDVKLANQKRNDIQNAVVNTGQAIRQDVGNFNTSVQKGQDNLYRAVAGSTGLMSPEGGQAPAPAVEAGQVNSTLPAIRTALQQVGGNLPPEIRQQYQALVGAFDDQGNLIRNTVNEDGSALSRTLDGAGNLTVNRFDSTGMNAGQLTLNVPQMLQTAQQYLSQYQQPAFGSLTNPY